VNLANILDLEEHGAEAALLRERALHIFETKLGPSHPLVAATLVEIARQKVVDHQPREAEQLLARAARIQPPDDYAREILAEARRQSGGHVDSRATDRDPPR
jgi:hypothetical protein